MMYKIVIDGWSREMHIPEVDADRGWIELVIRPPLSYLVTGETEAKIDIITLRFHRTNRDTFEYVNRNQDPFKNSEIFLLFSRMLAAAGPETKKEVR